MSPTSSPGELPDAGQATSMHVHRAISGDTESLSWLIERLNPLLLAQTAWRMGLDLQSTHDPADIVHEAWLVLLPRMASLPPRDGRMTPVLLRFLSTTIIHKLNNLLRHELRKHLRTGTVADETDPLVDLSGPQSEVIRGLVRNEARCQVREVLDGLPDDDREIVLLRGIEQQSSEDVAALLGLSHEAVYKRYSRALQKLRARLPRSVFDELCGG